MIEQAVLRLSPGAYQNLMEEYLRKKYKYSNVMPLGTHVGTDKTTKGVPDTIVRCENGQFILINYGTVEHNSFDKIKADILACLNTEKTHIQENDIEQIVCCHTATNLNAGQLKELYALFPNLLLVGLTDLSYDILDQYHSLALNHLDISLDTHQILNEEEFIAESDKNAYSTTLKMPLLCREKELEELSTLLENHPIVLLSGASGVGKTRLAMEAAHRYAEKNNAVLRYIKSNSLPIYNDLVAEFSHDVQYIIVVDDANRLEQISILVSMTLDKQSMRSLKLILTVRDYAKEKLLNDMREMCIPIEYPLETLSGTSIDRILQENLQINDLEVRQHICKIAKGNARIAIMAGTCVKNGDIKKVENSFELFQDYYASVITRLDKNELFVGSLIAFFDSFKLESSALPLQLAAGHGIDYGTFLDCCHNLEQKEIIDIRYDRAVKFDNQNLQDYFLYYSFFEAKLLTPSEIILSTFSGYRKRLLFAFNTLAALFYTDVHIQYLKSEVNKAWQSLKNAPEPIPRDYIESFIQILPDEALFYINQQIKLLPYLQNDLSEFDFEKTAHQNNIHSKDIQLLSALRRTDYFEEAIELAIEFFERNNNYPMDFYFLIKKEWGYNHMSFHEKFAQEHILLDKLIENYRLKQSLPSAQFLYFAVSGCLRLHFSSIIQDIDDTYRYCTYYFTPSEELLILREKSISAVAELFVHPAYNALAVKLLHQCFTDADKKTKGDLPIVQHDIAAIGKHLVPLLRVDTFAHCLLLEHFEEVSARFGVCWPEAFPTCRSNPVYAAYQVLNKDHLYDKKSQEEHEAEIAELSKNTPASIFEKLWVELNKCGNDIKTNWPLQTSIALLFTNLRKDREKFLRCTNVYFEQNIPCCYSCDHIIDGLLDHLGWSESRQFILQHDFPMRNHLLAALYSKVPAELIDDSLISHILEIASDAHVSYRTAAQLNAAQNGFMVKYTQRLLACSSKKPYLIVSFFESMCREKESPENFIAFFGKEITVLHSAFIQALNSSHFFFGAQDMFFSLIRHNPAFLASAVMGLDDNISDADWGYIFNSLWQLDEFEKYITIVVDARRSCYQCILLGDSKLEEIISIERADQELKSKKIKWLRKYISENYDDIDKMQYLFETVCNCSEKQYMEAMVCFCEHNQNYEDFVKLRLIPTSDFWSGSEIPVIEKKLSRLSALSSALRGKTYIEHRLRISHIAQELQEHKENVLMKEFLEGV